MQVVIINDASVARGGATALALLEAELLRARGVEVLFAAGDDAGNPLLSKIGAASVGLGDKRLLEAGGMSMLRGLHNLLTARTLAPVFAALGPQTVFHVHGWSQILSPSLFSALAPYRERVVITAHDFFLACPNGAYADFRAGRGCARKPLGLDCIATNCDKRSYAHKLWRIARQINQARTLRFGATAPQVLMIHEAMREPLARAGVPAACLRTLTNPVTAWSAERIPAESNAEFLFVGRFAEEKGPDLAARAARRAGVKLTLIGDGPLLEPLRAQYPEFTFLGRLAPAEVARRANSARAIVMPSRYPEPFGLVAVEALWSGLPALVAGHSLLAPDILSCEAGFAFDPHDEAGFAAALRHASDDAQVLAMSRNAFSRTRGLALSPEDWCDRLIETFAAVASRSLGASSLPARRVEGEDVHVFDGQN